MWLLTLAILASQPTDSVVFDAKPLNWEERCTVEALQGLVNRSGPRLYLDLGSSWDRKWIEIYQERFSLKPVEESDLSRLLKRFPKEIKGLIVYDPSVDGSRYVALTAAGLKDALPVAPTVLEGTPAFKDMGLKILLDLRGQFQNSQEAYEWALKELMPQCNKSLAHAVNGRVEGVLAGCGPFAGFDWPVSRRGFVFNLSCSAKEAKSYGDSVVGGSPWQAEVYAAILKRLDPPAQITGYGEPEDVWCRLLSQNGHYSFHFGDNWSFHHQVKGTGKPFQQKVRFTEESSGLDPDKFLVCFMTSEGDTMKGPLPFFFDSWFDPARGEVPNNWGINPLMAELFPGMLEYYYQTATDNDYFFVGCSGAGYVYPDSMPNLEQFCQMTRKACLAADTPCIDLWGARNKSVIETYARETQPLGLTINAQPAKLSLLPGNVPAAFHALAYWQQKALGDWSFQKAFQDDKRRAEAVGWLVGQIEMIAQQHTPPFIILVYGDLHHYDRHAQVHAEIARALDPKRFKAVRLDEAMSTVRRWSRDRVLVGGEGLNERMAWAALQGVPTQVDLSLTNGRNQETDATWSILGLDGPLTGQARLKPESTLPLKGVQLTLSKPLDQPVKLMIESPGHKDLYDVDLTLVPCADSLPAGTFVAQWSAERLQHNGGSRKAMADALWGQAWASPEAGGAAGHVVFGPYADLSKARYRVAFRIRGAAGSAGEEGVATLEAFAGGFEGAQAVLCSKDVQVKDLVPEGTWHWFSMDMDWPGPPSQLETRVLWHGRTPILIDRIVVFRLEAL